MRSSPAWLRPNDEGVRICHQLRSKQIHHAVGIFGGRLANRQVAVGANTDSAIGGATTQAKIDRNAYSAYEDCPEEHFEQPTVHKRGHISPGNCSKIRGTLVRTARALWCTDAAASGGDSR